MQGGEGIGSRFELPPATQIGVIVRDLEKSAEYYSKAFGIGPFTPISDLRPDKSWYLGELCPVHLRVSRAMWGAMEFELIQPVSGKSIHHDFLASNGEGINHLGIEAENYDEVVAGFQSAGFRAVQALEVFLPHFACWGRATFFDTRSIGGIIFEVSSRPWLAAWFAEKARRA